MYADEPDEPTDDRLLTSANYAEAAAFALDAYHVGAAPHIGEDHRTDPRQAEELLGSLLHDLFHYADRYGADFQRVSREAMLDYLNERLDETPFRTGTLVQVTTEAADDPTLSALPRRGVITDIHLAPGRQARYDVRSPGEPVAYQFASGDLEPGPPFRPIPTRDGIVDTPLDAEQALIQAVARLGLTDRLQRPPQPCNLHDKKALLTALSSWAGVTEERLIDLLGPRFDEELQRLERSAAQHPAALAAADYPIDPTDGLSSPGPEGPSPNRPGGSPRHGPRLR